MTDVDGNVLEFEADRQFVTHPSPILTDDLRAGEFYDARLEEDIRGRTDVDFDDHLWTPAVATETPRGKCRIVDVPPILPQRELVSVSILAGKHTVAS